MKYAIDVYDTLQTAGVDINDLNAKTVLFPEGTSGERKWALIVPYKITIEQYGALGKAVRLGYLRDVQWVMGCRVYEVVA